MRSRVGRAAVVLGLVVGGVVPERVLAQVRSASSPEGRKLCVPTAIDGEVHAGESFRKRFGADLEVELRAVRNGWVLQVWPADGTRPPVDFAELATPPYRSVSPLLLTTDYGFRAQDVVGWNPRQFQFLTSRVQYGAAEKARAAVLASRQPTTAEEMAVARIAGRAAEGTLQIRDARLVPGTADQARAASLVATHFLTTAHTLDAQTQKGAAGGLGEVEWVRFRILVGGDDPRAGGCGVGRAGSR